MDVEAQTATALLEGYTVDSLLSIKASVTQTEPSEFGLVEMKARKGVASSAVTRTEEEFKTAEFI